MGAYYTERELWFSALYGGAVYRKTGETGERLGCPARERGVSRGNAPGLSFLPSAGTSPVLTNLSTGEQVYLRRLPDGTDRAEFIRRVLSPPPPDLALWPVDLIPLSAEQREGCTICAEHSYVPEYAGGTDRMPGDAAGKGSASGTGKVDTSAGSGTGKVDTSASGTGKVDTSAGSDTGEALAAAFPLASYDDLRDGQSVLDGCAPLNWKNPSARALAVRLAEAVERLNRNGWLWLEFHPSRLFFRENGRVFFDFSCLTVPTGGEAALYQRYPVEFADPAVVRGIVPRPDERSQNYSLCALLFYVLYGRLPCDGALLAGYPDDDTHNHYVKFRDYHKMPVFLFDPDDSQNAPGVFAEDEELSALWRECPEDLKDLFTEALCRKSAERRGGTVPPAAEILERLRRAFADGHGRHRKR